MTQSIIDEKQKDVERYTVRTRRLRCLASTFRGKSSGRGWAEGNRIHRVFPAVTDRRCVPYDRGRTLTAHTRIRVSMFNDGSDNVSSVKENERENASNVSDGVSFSREENVLLAEMSIPTGEVSVDHVTNAFGTS